MAKGGLKMKIRTIVLTLCFILICTSSAFAASAKDSLNSEASKVELTEELLQQNQELAAQDFINFISPFFKHPDKYTVFDIDGNDISDEFYAENIKLYKNGDFEALRAIADVTISTIDSSGDSVKGSAIGNSVVVPMAIVGHDLTEWLSWWTDWPTFEFQVYVSGDYLVDTTNSRVTNTYAPSVWLEWYSQPQQGTCELKNVSTSSSKTYSNTRAKFSTTFSVYRNWEGVEWYVGRYTGWIEGDLNGTLVDWSPKN